MIILRDRNRAFLPGMVIGHEITDGIYDPGVHRSRRDSLHVPDQRRQPFNQVALREIEALAR